MVIGLVIAVIGGTMIEKLHMEKYVEDFIKSANAVDIASPSLTQKERLVYAKDQVVSTFKKVFPYILAGVAVGAVIHTMIMLRKAVKPKLLGVFIGICTLGIMIVGYLFNIFQFLLI